MRWALSRAILGLLLLVALPAPFARAEAALAAMQARLIQTEILRADFRQEKIMRALSRPLLSQGKIVFVAGRGVLWRVIDPFASQILMRSGEVVEWDAEGQRRPTDTGGNPVFGALTDVVLGVLSGNESVLRQHFDLASVPADQGWLLTLEPKSEELGTVVSSVRVSGDRFIQTVHILESKGDTTTIRFSSFSTSPSELDESEKSYFSR